MGIYDYFSGATDNEARQYEMEAEAERARRLHLRMQAEAERQANADAMREAAMQYQQQQQAIQQGYEQDAANSLDKFGLLRLIGDYNIGRDAATQGLSQSLSFLSGDTNRADEALAPTLIPRQAPPQVPQRTTVGNAVMKPQSLYESIIGQAESAGEQINAKTKEAKERAKALLRTIRNAR